MDVDQVDRIKRKLAWLPEAAGLRRMNPALSAEQVAAFEAQHGVRLPEAYRLFLTEIGNGGWAPDNPILPLEQWDRGLWWDSPGGMAAPCPLPLGVDFGQDWIDRYLTADEDSDDDLLPGTLTLAHLGGTFYLLLVVSGPARGRVLEFDRDGQPPRIHPQPDFLTWYEERLDRALPSGAVEPEPLVLPLGRMLGPLFTAAGPPAEVGIRLAGRTYMTSPDEYVIWRLAHGPTEARWRDRPWTAQSIAGAAAERDDFPDARAQLAGLRRKGLVTYVRRGTSQAVDFAARHRVVPQLPGLGNTPQEPGFHRIGPPANPFVKVDSNVYQLWIRLPIHADLWSACQGLTRAARNSAPGFETDPERLLDALLDVLHLLLAVEAAHLDAPDPRAPRHEEASDAR
ncbi:SMI1/KNR4 family protein [Phytohabitans sp. ZYX-F-186]|uniref:SMI1/KNR4 family protein n=1 Tax=Phytohabitans maris TaxID=3071409 RepID=A0ABU0ZKB6_9ACTN|nr:SMI1/KNR4 family protein [Phytohabitans sp. ZYX-F-186]MDQ7907496.1 SMI1/KNR4 family protein [Phytohabitans sp. ZYX-F-186]